MAYIFMINSSGRRKSNSSALCDKVAEGAKESGHEVEVVEIAGLNIKPCRGCQSCLQPKSSYCAIRDDMHLLYASVVKADILIYASPIYWFNLCGQIKQFIDRCYAVAVNPDPEGPSLFAGKTIGAIFTYGGDDPFDSGCINAIRSLQDICAHTGSTWAGALYASATEEGEAAADPALLEKARQYGLSL